MTFQSREPEHPQVAMTNDEQLSAIRYFILDHSRDLARTLAVEQMVNGASERMAIILFLACVRCVYNPLRECDLGE